MKIKIEVPKNTVNQAIESFLEEKKGSVAEKTYRSYKGHFKTLSHYVDYNRILDKSVCVDLYNTVAELPISQESKNSYLRVWRAFIKYTDDTLPLPHLRKTESVKKTYTEEEIIKLTMPPKGKYDFTELRNYCMTLLLCDTGIRASSLRNMKPEDLQDGSIVLRHTKTGQVQILPIGNITNKWLHKYAEIMHNYTFLFTNQYGKQFTETGLQNAIKIYNHSRGVEACGIHMWRHTFSKNYLLNNGNAFALQKMLGHSTLNTTKIYCRLFDSDLQRMYVSSVDKLSKRKIGV